MFLLDLFHSVWVLDRYVSVLGGGSTHKGSGSTSTSTPVRLVWEGTNTSLIPALLHHFLAFVFSIYHCVSYTSLTTQGFIVWIIKKPLCVLLFLQCLWCITTKSCVTYPVRTILPPHALCPLNDARWGLCWSKTTHTHRMPIFLI